MKDHICSLCAAAVEIIPPSSPRKCAFKTGIFNGDNYRCETALALRELGDLMWYPKNVSGISHTFTESNENFSTFDVSEIDFKDPFTVVCLWISWYKSRGRTQGMYMLYSSDNLPRPPTEEECLIILNYYKGKLQHGN